MKTSTPPSLDIWQFPCEFPLKVVGKATPEFEAFVLTTLHKHIPDLVEGALAMNPSKNGSYLAITIKIQATSKAQLDAIYVELNASEWVLMTL